MQITNDVLLVFGCIPPGVIIVLCWQIGQTQVKCICKISYSTYILHGILIKMKIIWCPVLCKGTNFGGGGGEKIHFSNASSIALSHSM